MYVYVVALVSVKLLTIKKQLTIQKSTDCFLDTHYFKLNTTGNALIRA